MAVATFYIKQHDLLPKLKLTLMEGTEIVDLSLAIGARLLVKNRAGLKVNGIMTILDQNIAANKGKVEYAWTGTDTDTVGKYNAEVEITWPGNKPQTFPAKQYFIVDVQNDLTD